MEPGSNHVEPRREKQPDALVIGAFGAQDQEAMRVAIERARGVVGFFSTTTEARRALASGATAPRCLFIDAAAPGAAELVVFLRGDPSLLGVAVVMIAPVANDQAFLAAYACGADDVVVRGDTGSVTRRLANLEQFDPTARPKATQGVAVIAHPDEDRRRVIGRILRLAGYEVAFATDAGELEKVVSASKCLPALVVAAEHLGPDGAIAAVASLRSGPERKALPAIILARDTVGPDLEAAVRTLDHTAVTSARAPADNLLFLANELLRSDVKNLRASSRLLHATICAFRKAGSLDAVHGLTYNISREGLYVRTLDPPSAGATIWFEMRAPFASEAVHLRGTVVWARRLNGAGGAAPPGFAMKIDAAACPPADRTSYEAAYEELRRTSDT